MKIKIGFDYEQELPGLYLYDAETGLVLVSEDVMPSEELRKKLESIQIDLIEGGN